MHSTYLYNTQAGSLKNNDLGQELANKRESGPICIN